MLDVGCFQEPPDPLAASAKGRAKWIANPEGRSRGIQTYGDMQATFPPEDIASRLRDDATELQNELDADKISTENVSVRERIKFAKRWKGMHGTPHGQYPAKVYEELGDDAQIKETLLLLGYLPEMEWLDKERERILHKGGEYYTAGAATKVLLQR